MYGFSRGLGKFLWSGFMSLVGVGWGFLRVVMFRFEGIWVVIFWKSVLHLGFSEFSRF